jgi:hypothetical protein
MKCFSSFHFLETYIEMRKRTFEREKRERKQGGEGDT